MGADMTDNQNQLVNSFLSGLAPLIEVAIQAQPTHEARKIANAIESGAGNINLIAVLSGGGELHLELTARLPDGDRRLVTVRR